MPDPTTVVAVPLRAHLRATGSLNAREPLVALRSELTAMVTALTRGLLVLSRRSPGIVGDDLMALTALRQAAGITAGVEPHWLWRYLTDSIAVQQTVITEQAARDELARRGWAIDERSTAKRLAFQCPAGVKEIPLIADGERRVIRRDHRDRIKGDVWTAAATASGTVTIADELSMGDGAVASLAGWIASDSEPPASLQEAASNLAAELPGLIRTVFAEARAVCERWRRHAAERLRLPPEDASVRAQVRRATAASVYEALKSTSSWVALDTGAAALKAERWQRLVAASEACEVGRERIERLMAAIEDQAAAVRRDPAVIALDLDGLDWRACSAISAFLERGVLQYDRQGASTPWSHPGWDAFLAAVTDREALAVFVRNRQQEDEGQESLAELARSWRRARGMARYTNTASPRLHVDFSASGTRGTLESAIDPSQRAPYRSRTEGVAVIRASVEWLGDVLSLEFHQGCDRQMTLTADDKRWSVRYLRNARRVDRAITGEAKTFDLAIEDERVSLVIPIQVGVSLGARETVTGFAVGGYYRSRPTDEPRQPDGLKTVVPTTGRVLGLDIGFAPVAAWSLLSRREGSVHQEADGVLGVSSEALLSQDGLAVHHPGLLFRDLDEMLRTGERTRRGLRAVARDPQARVEVHESLADRIRAVPASALAALPRAITSLVASLPAVATANGPLAETFLIGTERHAGGGLIEELANGVDRLLEQSLRGLTDPDLRAIARALLRPIAWFTVAYQRQRVTRADLGSVSVKQGLTPAEVTRRRDAIAARHGYGSEAEFHRLSLCLPGSVPLFARPTPEQEGVGLTAQLLLADFSERVFSLGMALAGWGQAPLARGAEPPAGDSRHAWHTAYGFLRTKAANMRREVHRTVAARIVDLAKAQRVDVLAIEHLTLETTSRADRESNGLTRRFAAQDWQAMILRAADLAGVATVLVDPSWTSQEAIAVESGRCQSPVFREPLADRVASRRDAARAIAWRSITGWQERTRFPVQVSAPAADGSRFARLRPGPGAKRAQWAVWQQRFARSQGVAVEDLTWRIAATGAATRSAVPQGTTWEGGDVLALTGSGWTALRTAERQRA